MNILILNAGSNSLKFEIVAAERGDGRELQFGRSLISGAYDDIGKEGSAFSILENKQVRSKEDVSVRDYGHAMELLLAWLENGGAKEHGIDSLSAIERIGHRVVHGGDVFHGPVRITNEVIDQIQQLKELAPLHNAAALEVIRAAHERVGSQVPMIAVFDTVFHQSIPAEAAHYPLPQDLCQRHKIRRYGFHGISHRYMMLRYGQITQRAPETMKIVTLHLEGGSSAAAIQYGKSIDTSMGFTPLEGLMMGTRSGDIDPALVCYLMRKEGMDIDRVEKFLNKECGLMAVSQVSADTRKLSEHLGDPAVELALRMFSYRVRKYVGAYLAALGGAEAIVVGGGIGENTPYIRERIFKNFEWFGAELDIKRNEEVVDREAPITTAGSRLTIWVVPTQEGLMMAKDIAEVRL
jgi:acetate kinase